MAPTPDRIILFKDPRDRDNVSEKSLGILDTYCRMKAEHAQSDCIIAGMKDTIDAIKVVHPTAFKHTGDPKVTNVIDISPTRIKPRTAVAAFKQAVQASRDIQRYFLPLSDPAIHIEILQ